MTQSYVLKDSSLFLFQPVCRLWQNLTISCMHTAIFSCVICVQYNQKSANSSVCGWWYMLLTRTSTTCNAMILAWPVSVLKKKRYILCRLVSQVKCWSNTPFLMQNLEKLIILSLIYSTVRSSSKISFSSNPFLISQWSSIDPFMSFWRTLFIL